MNERNGWDKRGGIQVCEKVSSYNNPGPEMFDPHFSGNIIG